MRIRAFHPDDLATIVALFRDTVHRVNCRDYCSEQVEAWAPDQIDLGPWAHRLAGRFTVVAEIDGQVAGFAELEDDGHVDYVYVHADHQRRGVARALVSAIEAEARRHGLPWLFTEASITARPFFERHGFITLRKQVVECRGVELVNYSNVQETRRRVSQPGEAAVPTYSPCSFATMCGGRAPSSRARGVAVMATIGSRNRNRAPISFLANHQRLLFAVS